MPKQRNDDIVNEVFDEILVLRRDESDTTKFVCLCSCGKTFSTTKQRLKNGSTRSCGCKRHIYFAEAVRTHGASTNGKNCPEYQSYIAMMHRCYNEKRENFKRYGGNGIGVQDSWREPSPHGYLNFLKDMVERPDGTSLDRINGNEGYSKENCRWADTRLQSHNTVRRKKPTSTSKYRGVSLRKTNGKYMARIGDGKGKYEWLGEYLCEIDAAKAYNKRALEIFGDDAVVNIIPDSFDNT